MEGVLRDIVDSWSYSVTQDSVGQSLDQPSLAGPALAVSLD